MNGTALVIVLASTFLEPFRALRGGASLWALFTGLAIAFDLSR
jgi:hypothetical protein